MHAPDRSDLTLGLALMLPGIVTAVLVDELAVTTLVDPRTLGDSIAGAIFLGGWGGPEHGIPWVGLAVVHLLYYVGVGAVVVSSLPIVRQSLVTGK
ncbi:hypothetical protein C479_14098 [Halovivax asiaticus JCM 14624]|uniref:Uncharacterized protein n=1 Tax=Halovivax asiaticus JCM 14624 TaxID=1227490 RepID=M0BDC5_9EURY|nr:hypothetical protein [Halovivax asiaticus]ELZ08477.1 hypothetical protein C479_14098 [Halovivax asiaticus JCM 14624]